MKKLFLATLLAAALVIPILAIAGADSQEKPFQATFAGSFTNKDDLSYTGVLTDSTGIGFTNGKSSLGNFTAQVVSTSALTGKDCTSPSSAKGLEGQVKGSAHLLTFDDTGDQLFLQLNPGKSGLSCTVLGAGTTTIINFDVMGGTGRYEGATGTIVQSSKLTPLAVPASPGKGRFTSVTGSFEGTVVLASGKTWPF